MLIICAILAILFGGNVSVYAGTPIVLFDGAVKLNFAGVLTAFTIGGFSWLIYSRSRRRKPHKNEKLDAYNRAR